MKGSNQLCVCVWGGGCPGLTMQKTNLHLRCKMGRFFGVMGASFPGSAGDLDPHVPSLTCDLVLLDLSGEHVFEAAAVVLVVLRGAVVHLEPQALEQLA